MKTMEFLPSPVKVKLPHQGLCEEGVPQGGLNCFDSIQAHYENNGIPAKPG